MYIEVVLLGDSGTGKTTLYNAVNWCGGRTGAKTYGTIAADVRADMVIETPGKSVKLRLYDTASQERYRSLTASYYRGAHGCLIVFDVTKLSSFENINYWLSDLKEYTAQPEICAILVGTKCHVPEEEREVSTERAQKFAESVGLPYMEVSAEESINVTEVFEKLADLIIENQTKRPPVTNVVTPGKDRKPPQKKKWCSC